MGRRRIAPYLPGARIAESIQTRMAALIREIAQIPQDYHRLILWISETTGFADNLLHIHSGLIILLLARLMTRRAYGSFVPFLCVVLAEAANELLDYLAYGWRPDDSYADIANTLFWPLLISLVARLQPVPKRDKV